jgi:hypothetical protein
VKERKPDGPDPLTVGVDVLKVGIPSGESVGRRGLRAKWRETSANQQQFIV